MKPWLALILITVSSVALLERDSHAVIGGSLTPKDSFISQVTVGLEFRVEGSEFSRLCTGTLITDDFVLTAAHCVQNSILTKIHFTNDVHGAVLTGNTNHVIRAAVAQFPHPAYTQEERSKRLWDIALIQFSGGIPAGFKKAPLGPKYGIEVASQAMLIAAGMGRNDSTDQNHLPLKQTPMQVIQTAYLGQWIQFFQEKTGAICHGDSGGPVFVEQNGNLFLAGVIHAADQEEDIPESCGYTSTATDLGTRVIWDWIRSVLERNTSDTSFQH